MAAGMKHRSVYMTAFCLAMTACSRQPASEQAGAKQPATEQAAVRQMPAGKEFAGFLSSYDNLKPNPNFENTVSFVKSGAEKNIHGYIGVIIDPVQIYVATNADMSKLPDRGRTALAEYFQRSIADAVESAFPVVTEPGPLVLRLRTALVGVDVGGDIPGGGKDKDDPKLDRAMNIGKVGVEMELVDSVTGEQIAAAVDRQNLGDGAEIGSAHFEREEKFAEARKALDGWAARLRAFLDSAHELSPEEQAMADKHYHPYGQ
jgi:hypothetical protein